MHGMDVYNNVLVYAQTNGFPNAHLYGEDGGGHPDGLTFGGDGNQAAVLTYTQNSGFPNAQLYGTTTQGGTYVNGGTVFALTP